MIVYDSTSIKVLDIHLTSCDDPPFGINSTETAAVMECSERGREGGKATAIVCKGIRIETSENAMPKSDKGAAGCHVKASKIFALLLVSQKSNAVVWLFLRS